MPLTHLALGRHIGRWACAAWRAVLGQPWRAVLGVVASFALTWAGLAVAPRAAAAERWERLGSLAAAGPVRQIVASGAQGEPILYALVERWGIFVSPDGGRNWLPPDRYLPRTPQGAMALNALALAPQEPQFLLLAVAGAQAGGRPSLFKSGDGGLHWVPRRGLGSRAVEALAVAPDNVTYAASTNRHYRSVDGGDTWFEEGSRPIAADVLALASDGEVLYVGTKGGLWMTADHGDSWRWALAQHTVPAVAALGRGRAYAAADDGLYYSADGGASWRRLEAPAVAGAVAALAVSPGAPDRLFAAMASGGLKYSPDAGVTWHPLGHTLLRSPVTALAIDPSSPRRIYVGTREGIWRCTLPEAPAVQVDHGRG